VSAFGDCLAHITGAGDPPADPAGARGWLAERNLGLVPVRDPEGFTWAGPFLARVGGPDEWVVMFGVPPGVLYDPAGGRSSGAPVEAFVVAPLNQDVAPGEQPYGPAGAERGVVDAIVIAAEAEAQPVLVESAMAIAGLGLDGDRYADGRGTFSPGPDGGRALTLIEGEVLDELGLAPELARRNVVTRGIRLNPLVGARFTVGGVACAGRRLCEPCAHLERLSKPGTLRALVRRGGLRADVLTNGEIAVGDAVLSGSDE
jgi:hypothetical protein